MKTTHQTWFYPVILVYALMRSLSLLVLQVMSHGVSITDWLFVSIPVILSLCPIAVVDSLSSQLPLERKNVFSGILITVNIVMIFVVDYLCFCVEHDAQNGIVIFLFPFALLGLNFLVFVACISWCKGYEWLAEKRTRDARNRGRSS